MLWSDQRVSRAIKVHTLQLKNSWLLTRINATQKFGHLNL